MIKQSSKKTSKKTTKKASSANFEESLWGSANKVRSSVGSSEYKHIVPKLISGELRLPESFRAQTVGLKADRQEAAHV